MEELNQVLQVKVFAIIFDIEIKNSNFKILKPSRVMVFHCIGAIKQSKNLKKK